MKVKIIYDSGYSLESEINKWLSNNNVKVLDIKYQEANIKTSSVMIMYEGLPLDTFKDTLEETIKKRSMGHSIFINKYAGQNTLVRCNSCNDAIDFMNFIIKYDIPTNQKDMLDSSVWEDGCLTYFQIFKGELKRANICKDKTICGYDVIDYQYQGVILEE